MISSEDRKSIEEDLRLNKTKEEIIASYMQLIDMLEESTDQTRRALIESGDLKVQ